MNESTSGSVTLPRPTCKSFSEVEVITVTGVKGALVVAEVSVFEGSGESDSELMNGAGFCPFRADAANAELESRLSEAFVVCRGPVIAEVVRDLSLPVTMSVSISSSSSSTTTVVPRPDRG